MDLRSSGPKKRMRLALPTILATTGGVFAAAGCSTVESPFAPDFGVEETPRLSVSEEAPLAEERHAPPVDVAPSPGGESQESSVDVMDDQPKPVPRVTRVSVAPLVVIDGVVQPAHFPLSEVRHLDIDHVEIVKGAAAIQLYRTPREGERHRHPNARGTPTSVLNELKSR